MTKDLKVQGDTLIYNGVKYKKVEEPKEPTLRDIIIEVLETHISMYEYVEYVDIDALTQELIDHIVEWIPDYSHNDGVTHPNNVTIHNIEDFKKGWDAHVKETLKVFDWCIK